LFLATKTEENCRKTKEIVIAVAKVAQKNTSLIIDEQSKEYWRWRDSILLYEELMLELLTFDVVLSSPYRYLYRYIQQLQIEDNKPIRNVAWAFVNDSCMTTLCLRMPASDIAISAIYFAIKFHNETIPDDEDGAAWWEQLGGEPDLIVKAVGIMHDFWHDNPLKQADKPYGSAEYASSQEDLDNTRRRGSEGGSSEEAEPSEALSQAGNGSVKRKSDEDGEDGEESMPKKARREHSLEVKSEDVKRRRQGTDEGLGDSQDEGEANVEEGEVA
jgi:protein BUR2